MPTRAIDMQLPPERRLLEAQLPQRLDRLRQRGDRLASESWDINTMALLAGDARYLTEAFRHIGADALADTLATLGARVAALLDPPALPDHAAMKDIAEALQALAGQKMPRGSVGTNGADARIIIPGHTHENGFPLLVAPPARYWERFGSAPPPRAPVEDDPLPDSVALQVDADADPGIAAGTSAHDVVAATPVSNPPGALVFHLASAGSFADSVDQRLAQTGYAPVRFERSADVLAAIEQRAPSIVLLDDATGPALTEIGSLLKRVRASVDHPVWLVAQSRSADTAARLHAVRAGCDALIEQAHDAEAVVARIAELTADERDDPYRIMIIEDDATQTLFAESILRRNGMQTRAFNDALEALDALDEFAPDLILMDLYMPGCDGIDLTALIRQREPFLTTPIVFLSGEHNTDKHFEALQAGGDDFLSKPVRAKHLLSAVTNRVRRTRQRQRHRRRREDGPAQPAMATPEIVTIPRTLLMERLSQCLAMEDAGTRAGGLLVLAIDAAQSKRLNADGAAMGPLLEEIGAFMVRYGGSRDLVAVDGEERLLLLNPDCDSNLLEAHALSLRDRIARARFRSAGSDVGIVLDVGVCPFVAGATQAEKMRGAAIGAVDSARAAGRHGVAMVRDAGSDIDAGLIDRIRFAIDGTGFQLLFQPIVSLRGEENELFQALLRLHGDAGRVHTAAEVIPAAERSGVIGAVDRWVLEHCINLIASRASSGRAPLLFVNVSSETLRDSLSPTWLQALLDERKVGAQMLSLELRTSDVASSPEAVERYACAMRELGASVTLAGFDTDLVGEDMLATLPADFIKLAPRYLRFDHEQTRQELRALVDRAHECGKRVIAPRVEDARGAATLWTAGVDFIQGNFVQQAGHDLAFDFHASIM